MKKYFGKNALKLAIAVVLVVAVILVSSHFLGGKAGILTNASRSASTPFDKAISSMVDWLESIYGYIYKYDQLLAENESLRAQLAEAQEKNRDAAEALEENAQLREALNLQQKHSDYELESARIVSWTSTNWSSTFTIGKGSDQGIELNDPVITAYGALVGQIIELGSNWATVRTVIDIDFSVGALVGEAGNAAMVMGDYALMKDGCTKLTYLTEGTQLLKGDPILTSGKGGIFPQGLLIGNISEIMTEAGGQTSYGIIEPGCDLGSISQVFIIKSYDVAE